MKKALLIAFHFPPLAGSSGLQRVLSLTRHLPPLNWLPLVLTANKRAYETTNDSQLSDIPESTEVVRSFALNTRKHLSIRGRYIRYLALPDQWVTWCFGGIFSGLRLIRNHRPVVIWSTYPIATAHLIGLILQKCTGLPWVADFRDSMSEDHYPHDPTTRRIYQWIERKTVRACSKAVFTTPSTLEMYRLRYPEIPNDRWVLIPNGYDEGIFAEVEKKLPKRKGIGIEGPITLVHSGVVYPSERDPSDFFLALSRLKAQGRIDSSHLQIKFRACWHEDVLMPMLKKNHIEDLVQLLPPIPYREALTEIMMADALLILQASNCNHQVPAKVYEYFRARRPVLGLTDPAGDTAKVMRDAGINDIAPLDDADAIAAILPHFLQRLEHGTTSVASSETIHNSSRQHSAHQLSDIFEQISA